MSWGFDFDIFSSFLLIIDLGLFLVFFVISLHLTFLFSPQLRLFTKNKWFFILLVMLVSYYNLPINAKIAFPLVISFINWYGFFELVFFSELHILFECYFNLASLEFFAANLYLYLAVLFIYYLIYVRYSVPLINNKTLLKLVINKYIKCSLHIKWQNPLKQQNTRSWIKSWT